MIGVSVPAVGVGLLLITLASLGAGTEEEIVFPRREADDGGIPPARFPHSVHRIYFKCYACHDAIFRMKAGANPVTMDAIQAGKFCGSCHDGKTAFPVAFHSCTRCHRQ